MILHIGTNDIFKLSPDEFPAAINNLFATIKQIKTSVHLLYSAMLPRPVDYFSSKDLVVTANMKIKKLCKYRKNPFLKTFKPFMARDGKPYRHMFAVRDGGLHLNTEGSRVLSNFYLQVVKTF